MTEKKEFTFLSTDGRTDLHGVIWQPKERPVAVLQIVHGIAEHIGRYDSFARFLSEQGVAVVGHDQLGHGLSAAPNETLSYLGDGNTWQTVVDDIYFLHNRLKKEYPDVPHVLLGHSMGSFAVRSYLIRHPKSVEAAILMGTAWVGGLKLAAGIVWTKLIGLRVPDRTSDYLTKRVFSPYLKPFRPNRTNLDWISADSDNIDAYQKDHLCGAVPTVGLLHEMLCGIRFNQRFRNLDKMDHKTPILLLSGAKDPVGDFGAGVRQTYAEFKRSGIADCTWKLYPELRHELLHESAMRQTVYGDIWNWIKERVQ